MIRGVYQTLVVVVTVTAQITALCINGGNIELSSRKLGGIHNGRVGICGRALYKQASN